MQTLTPLLALALLVAGCGGDGAGSGATSGLRVSTEGWKTDFARHSVPLGEISSGGAATRWDPADRRAALRGRRAGGLPGRSRAGAGRRAGRARPRLPLQILVWHEIVNDDFAGTPLAVTYRPLCNSALVFDRRVDGRTLRFGTTGNLRKSDLVMWDAPQSRGGNSWAARPSWASSPAPG
jgi:hypothetical protein